MDGWMIACNLRRYVGSCRVRWLFRRYCGFAFLLLPFLVVPQLKVCLSGFVRKCRQTRTAGGLLCLRYMDGGVVLGKS